MSTPNSIIIDGVEYTPITDSTPAERRIVVAQRGWVFVGNWSQNGTEVTLTNASVIRRWGTTKGLGQLALDGPTASTVLDPCGTARFHIESIVTTLDVRSGL